jgi:FdhD protein
MLDDLAELGWTSYRKHDVDSWTEGHHSTVEDCIIEEVPVVLVYNAHPHVVMLTSPLNLEDFALGFSLTEGIIARKEEAEAIRVVQRAKGVEVRISIPEERAEKLLGARRNMTGRTGCGLCGATTLEQAIRPVPPVGAGISITASQLQRVLKALSQHQSLNRLTGAAHAASWVNSNNEIVCTREDVGRHNALDKLIGALAQAQTDFEQGWLIVTSRASYEMVQKACSVGITLLVAISAPTGLAIRLAQDSGLTLVGFARNNRYVIYTHPHRLQSA